VEIHCIAAANGIGFCVSKGVKRGAVCVAVEEDSNRRVVSFYLRNKGDKGEEITAQE